MRMLRMGTWDLLHASKKRRKTLSRELRPAVARRALAGRIRMLKKKHGSKLTRMHAKRSVFL